MMLNIIIEYNYHLNAINKHIKLAKIIIQYNKSLKKLYNYKKIILIIKNLNI